ncbi:DNA/RNA nuclease SfsA [Isachenkonia alkalipeptolytica]|uniref:Sugar fermentation stimulation protein homolog n=1 Tax=Isachenkonia alkalipeptolytica TaxID=2565777 RepID=A0AA43XJW9_9CLOT|nr:DNA/RNA nuclease SfsA [Isachenkonia alkalipeptolytica]NBG87634.1 DNA/RNA nuclease SfsA [Isachenkonia alkalipeptolytica]
MGFIEIPGEKVPGLFQRRVNRFIGEVFVEGSLERVHIANTGRMKELLVKDAAVILRKVDQPHRKTKFDLLMVYHGDTLVSIDSKLPNQLLEKAFKEGSIPGFEGFTTVKREVTFGKSRFDLSLLNPKTKKLALIEAKCVTLVKNEGLSTFPDAPTLRGVKHVLELMEGLKAGYRGEVFFVVQRKDGRFFRPNGAMDAEFSKAVTLAKKAGVNFRAYNCEVTPKGIQLLEEIPVEIEG